MRVLGVILLTSVVGLIGGSCAVDHKVTGVPDKTTSTIGPDFVAASRFCDERYGQGTVQAEDCFRDFRQYSNIKVELDLKSILEFCKDAYPNSQADLDACYKDLSLALIDALRSSQ
jgi:hypothetical protein